MFNRFFFQHLQDIHNYFSMIRKKRYGRGNHIPFVGRQFLPFQEPHSDKDRFNYGTLDVSLPLDNNPIKTILYGIC